MFSICLHQAPSFGRLRDEYSLLLLPCVMDGVVKCDERAKGSSLGFYYLKALFHFDFCQHNFTPGGWGDSSFCLPFPVVLVMEGFCLP
jgi:hypothetical protein